MTQLGLFTDERPVIVLRLRQDDRVEVRWSNLDLYATFRDWRVALDMALHYEGFYHGPGWKFSEASVRVRWGADPLRKIRKKAQ